MGGKNCTTSGVASEIFSFSSDRFAFSETPEEENAVVECIEKLSDVPPEFKKKPPSLEDALESMEYGEGKSRELSEMFLERARRKLEEFDAPGLTAGDVAAIFCYTY